MNDLIAFSVWLDLIALSMEAGMDFKSALQHFPIFSNLLSQLKMGISKEQALSDFKRTWNHPQRHHMIDHFCDVLLIAWTHGNPLSPILKEHALNIRTEALFQIEKEIHKKQFKLLLPLFLLILPAVLLILFTPLILQILEQPF